MKGMLRNRFSPRRSVQDPDGEGGEGAQHNLGLAWRAFGRVLFTYKRQAFIISGFGFVSALANGTVPYIVGQFMDSLIEPNAFSWAGFSFPTWALFLLLWVVVQLIANMVDWRLSILGEWMLRNAHAGYISRASKHLLLLPVSFHGDRKMGKVTQQVERAAFRLGSILRTVVNLGPQFASIVIGLFFVLQIESLATIILLVGIALYVLFLVRTAPRAIEGERKSFQAYSSAAGYLWDAIMNVRSIKHFLAEEYFAKKIEDEYAGKAVPVANKAHRIWSGIGFAQRLVTLGTMGAIFLISVAMVLGGDMTIGDLVALNGYAAMVFGPFASLGMDWQSIQTGVVALAESEEILDQPVEEYEKKDGMENPLQLKGNITFENVSFVYPGRSNGVISEVSFEIKAGETVALVGESGVGKTTLADLLGGYYRPDEGEVFLDGYALSELPLRFVRSHMATVPQEPILLNESIRENLQFANREATMEQIEEAARIAHAHEFIMSFPEGYETKVGEWGLKLSIGQKQRIAIARAVLRNPSILILDEPTSALDAKTERMITKSLETLMEGRTTIIIAHRLSTVRKADKIIVLEKGRVAEIGTHEVLLKKENGVYRALHELQLGG